MYFMIENKYKHLRVACPGLFEVSVDRRMGMEEIEIKIIEVRMLTMARLIIPFY